MKSILRKSISILCIILFSSTHTIAQKTIIADEIRDFNDFGLALVKRGNLWGVIDTMGDFVLDYSIETSEYNKDIYLFEDIIVLKDRNTFYYNISGELIAESNQSELVSFNEGVTILWDKSNIKRADPQPTGYKPEGRMPEYYMTMTLNMVNKQGTTIAKKKILDKGWFLRILPEIDNPGSFIKISVPFHNGICILSLEDEEGEYHEILNKQFKTICKVRCGWIDFYYEGLARVYMENEYKEMKYGYVDTLGNIIIPPKFTNKPGVFSDGMAIVENRDGLFGYIDKSGNVVIDAVYRDAFPFISNYAVVQKTFSDAKAHTVGYCIIDRMGKELIDLNNNYVKDVTKDGLIRVTQNYKYGFLDINGRIVVPQKFSRLGSMNSNRAIAELRTEYYTKYGYIDKSGKFVIIVKEESEF